MKKRFLYIASFLLVIFYLLVLCISLRDRGRSVEYRMFYMDKALSYYMPDGGFSAYGCNRIFTCDEEGMYRNLGRGWAKREEEDAFSRIAEEYADLYINVEAKTERDYCFCLQLANPEEACPMSFYCNGVYMGELITDSEGLFLCPISSEYIAEGINCFAFCCEEELTKENTPEILLDALICDE